MKDDQWRELGYRRWPTGTHEQYRDGMWQRKLWQREGHDRSDSVGYLTWDVYVFPDRTGYQAHADLDGCDGPMGVRRMTWNPRELTPEIVRMVEAEYRRMAGVEEAAS